MIENKWKQLRDQLANDLNLPRWEIHGHKEVDDDYYLALETIIGKMDELLSDEEVKYEPCAINCHFAGKPPRHETWHEWFEEEGSKGIILGLRISALSHGSSENEKY